MDTHGGGNWPLTPAKACSTAGSLDYDSITTCYNGNQGEAMLQQAKKDFTASGVGALPFIYVNGKYAAPDYDDVKKAICAANPTSSACQ